MNYTVKVIQALAVSHAPCLSKKVKTFALGVGGGKAETVRNVVYTNNYFFVKLSNGIAKLADQALNNWRKNSWFKFLV